MNPELERNIWIELTPQRVIVTAVVLVLALFAAALPGSVWPTGVQDTARFLFYAIVVLWGTRNAALSVVGEIRDRTWDFQRLSSLSPEAMVVGKLFGATSLNWVGGAICLAVMVVTDVAGQGIAAAAIEFVFAICLGVAAQGAALLASLVAVRRRASAHSRRDIFLFQSAGLAAALAVFYLWQMIEPVSFFTGVSPEIETVIWWGQALDARYFFLFSLVALIAWILVGCYRAMRLELKMENRPTVWAGFVVFVCIYTAGFVPEDFVPDFHTRALVPAMACALLTYVMILLEPKDIVHLRWLAARLAQNDIAGFLGGLPAWAVSYGATVLMAMALIITDMAGLIAFSALGFLTRDIGIFILMQQRGRGSDFVAVMILVALYLLVPSILDGLGLGALNGVFLPMITLLGLVAPWLEALQTAWLATRRLSQPVRK